MSFVLRYITTDGTVESSHFDEDETHIDLSKKNIADFDVSQLINNKKIEILNLQGNKIPRLDLTPLRSCKRLDTILLDGWTDGETLLSDSSMDKVSNEILYHEIINFDALSYLPSLDSIRYIFPYVRKREPKWKLLHLLRNTLIHLDMGWMGYLDFGPKQCERLVKKLLSDGLTEDVHDQLVTGLIEQIDRGGPTIDLDVESMKDYGELVIRIDDVVEQRVREMQSQVVPILGRLGVDEEIIDLLESVGESIDTHYAELRMLWLSAYGYEVLTSLNLRTVCEMRLFSKVEEAFSALGYDLQVESLVDNYSFISWKSRRTMKEQGFDSPEPPEDFPQHISHELREYIWELAEYRHSISNQ